MNVPTIVIIPGFGETTNDPGYRKIKKLASREGFRVHEINIHWKRTTYSDWLQEALHQLPSSNRSPLIILGFSFGAMLTIEIARIRQCTHLILCSLSPYYSDSLKHLPKQAWTILGSRRMKAFASNHFVPVKVAAEFLVGDADNAAVIKNARIRSKQWKHTSRLTILPDVGHDLNHRAYVEALHIIMKKLRSH